VRSARKECLSAEEGRDDQRGVRATRSTTIKSPDGFPNECDGAPGTTVPFYDEMFTVNL
jgi:hypothetical protein